MMNNLFSQNLLCFESYLSIYDLNITNIIWTCLENKPRKKSNINLVKSLFCAKEIKNGK